MEIRYKRTYSPARGKRYTMGEISAMLGYALEIPTEKVGTFDTELVEEFFLAFTRSAGCALHLRQLSGRNSHHIIEGAFKSAARSLRQAVAVDPRFAQSIPSTKGVL